MTAYTLTRDRDGALTAETREPLGADRRELRVTTRKNSVRRCLECSAMVVQVHADGSGYTHAFGLAGGGDFSRVILHRDARCTEKTIRAMHEEALQGFAAVLADARAHYANRAA